MLSKARPSLRRALLAAALLCAPGGAPALAADPPAFTVAPAPSWVAPVEAELDARAIGGSARDGVRELLEDREVRVSGASVERYVHIARAIVSKSGIESTSELTFAIDPPHERLVLHHIRIRRGERADDALRPRELHVIQKESDLSQRMYVGTLSVVAFLHDVREGDVIDYAYSVNGWNPVLGPRFATGLVLGSSVPVRRLRVRLVTPRARSFTIAQRLWSEKPEEREIGDFHETTWDRRDVPAIQHEDATPRWFIPVPRVEVSEYRSWAEVVAWALPLYEPIPAASPALEAQIQRLRDASPSEGGRLVAALRFVQDDVRYLGIELGPSSHQPENPSVVLERRFGDCKDKTRLLVTVLRALGIKADPALVNPDLGRGLDDRSPSPLSFNHVIARAELGGKTYWLDPTMSSQRGGLDTLENPDYERALVVSPESRALATIPLPAPTEPSIDEIEEVRAPRYDAPAEVKVTTRYRGRSADGMRREIESTDRAELSRHYLNYYAREEPSVVEAAPPEIADDLGRDTLTVVERYRVPDFWKANRKSFHARLIANALPSPRISRRVMPLAIEYPTVLAHETRLVLPEAYPIGEPAQDLSDATASLHCTSSAPGATVSIRCRYETKRDFVPAAEVEAHLALVEKMRSELSYELTRGSPKGGGGDTPGWEGLLWLGGVGLAFGLVGVARYARRGLPEALRKRAYQRKRALDRGEAASTAIVVRSHDEIRARMSATRCACGAKPQGPWVDVSTSTALFGGRTLTSARTICPACGQARSLFFELPS